MQSVIPALDQVHNVLIILIITLMMALLTAAIAYFIDLVPTLIEGTQLASKLSVGAR